MCSYYPLSHLLFIIIISILLIYNGGFTQTHCVYFLLCPNAIIICPFLVVSIFCCIHFLPCPFLNVFVSYCVHFLLCSTATIVCPFLAITVSHYVRFLLCFLLCCVSCCIRLAICCVHFILHIWDVPVCSSLRKEEKAPNLFLRRIPSNV